MTFNRFLRSGVGISLQVGHQLHHKSKIVDGRQPRVKAVVQFEKVVQVAQGIMLTGMAITEWGDGFIPFDLFFIVDVEKLKPVVVKW